MTKVLAGKVAVITGSGSGIGLAIAQRFAASGARIMLCGRNRTNGEAAERSLREAGADARYMPVDVALESDVRALIDATVAQFGPPTILVNNAGPAADAFGLGPIHAVPTEMFEKTMRIGAYGAFWCVKYAIPHMIAAGEGVILNISALPATRAMPNMGAYAMAKAAMEALGRQIANDYAPHGIRCNNLVVGTVRPETGPGTADVSTLPQDFDHAALDSAVGRTTMLGSVGRYADVAAAALFLASSDSRYVTGANIPIEGGALAKVQYPDYADIMAAGARDSIRE